MMTANNMDLTGQIALVTGASRGIGAAIAELLAQHGAHVLISSRKIADCEQVAAQLRHQGLKADAMACHIGDMDHIANLFAAIKEQYGRLDILVNNAATNPYFGPILDTDLGAFQKTVDVNIRGYFLMSQQAAKMMADQGGGAIVNVASVNGVNPGPLQGIYSISKAAVIAMTQAFAKECAGMGVRVNALLPGFTNTKFASALVNNPVIREEALKHIPMQRIAEPNEMAGAVLYLVSPMASYTTGVALNVDGGYLLG